MTEEIMKTLEKMTALIQANFTHAELLELTRNENCIDLWDVLQTAMEAQRERK